jgi:hypothetical protein
VPESAVAAWVDAFASATKAPESSSLPPLPPLPHAAVSAYRPLAEAVTLKNCGGGAAPVTGKLLLPLLL